MRKLLQLASLGTCLAAGVLLAVTIAGNVRAADTTTTETTTTAVTTTETTTSPSTVTVEQTTTQRIIVPSPPTTTSSSESSSETPAWVWVLLSALAIALVAAIVLLGHRKHEPARPDHSHSRLDSVVASWISQGWAVQSQTAGEAVLARQDERIVISVDGAGHVFTRRT